MQCDHPIDGYECGFNIYQLLFNYPIAKIEDEIKNPNPADRPFILRDLSKMDPAHNPRYKC